MYLNYTITKCPAAFSASYCSAPDAVAAGGLYVPDRTRQKSESNVDLLDSLYTCLTVSFLGKNCLTCPGISHPSHSFRSLSPDGIFYGGDSFQQPEGTYSSDSSVSEFLSVLRNWHFGVNCFKLPWTITYTSSSRYQDSYFKFLLLLSA